MLKGLFRDDLDSPPQGGAVILIRCFPAFAPPYQMELIQRAEGAWTLKGWFLGINLLGALADLKLKSPALSDAEAVEALRIRPVAIQVDPCERRWRWLARLKPGQVLKLPRSTPKGYDGSLICWLESSREGGIVEAPLQDSDSLSVLSDPLVRLEKLLRAVHDPRRAPARP